ncbi:MAG: hypothetical protein GHCLOJNM_03540 [bacterium]|nr:hypothetical protein [bacterium]
MCSVASSRKCFTHSRTQGFILLFLFPLASFACDDATVRSAAFYDKRDHHRLTLMAPTGDPKADEIDQRLAAWAKTASGEFNVAYRRIDPNDPNIPWSEYGIPSAPPSFPVVVLSGTSRADKRFFLIDHWEPAPTGSDLRLLVDSPSRDALREELGKRIAVLLYIPGKGPAAGKAEPELRKVVESRAQGPLGVSILRVERNDPNERILISFTGTEARAEDWVAVVFGPGRLRNPLMGGAISAAALNDQIDQVIENCTCLRPVSSYGVDLPMRWSEALSLAALSLPEEGVEEEPVKEAFGIARAAYAPAAWTLGAMVVLVAGWAYLILRRRKGSLAA